MPDSKKSWMTMVAEYSGLAFAIPAGVVVGYLVGHWLDQRFGISALTVVGVIVGAVGGLIQIVRRLMRDMRDADR